MSEQTDLTNWSFTARLRNKKRNYCSTLQNLLMLVLPCTGWQATKRIYRHLLHLGQALADGACMTSCHSQCEHHDNSKVTILRGAGTKNLGLSYPARQALADGAMEHVWQAVTVNVNTMTTVTVTILRGTGTKNLGLSDPASLTTKITGQQDSCRGPRSWCCDSTSGISQVTVPALASTEFNVRV